MVGRFEALSGGVGFPRGPQHASPLPGDFARVGVEASAQAAYFSYPADRSRRSDTMRAWIKIQTDPPSFSAVCQVLPCLQTTVTGAECDEAHNRAQRSEPRRLSDVSCRQSTGSWSRRVYAKARLLPAHRGQKTRWESYRLVLFYLPGDGCKQFRAGFCYPFPKWSTPAAASPFPRKPLALL